MLLLDRLVDRSLHLLTEVGQRRLRRGVALVVVHVLRTRGRLHGGGERGAVRLWARGGSKLPSAKGTAICLMAWCLSKMSVERRRMTAPPWGSTSRLGNHARGM